MARLARVLSIDTPFHVTQRGNAKLIMGCDSWEVTPINDPGTSDDLFTKIVGVINATPN